MMSSRYAAIKAVLALMLVARAHRWIGTAAGGCGAIFMLHHVRPQARDGFAPNRLLEVTPQFLDETLRAVKAGGLEPVSIGEAHRRLVTGEGGRRFAVFTLDDGYRDNLVHAAPVFRRHACPFTVYVTSRFASGEGILWWEIIEEAIRRSRHLRIGEGSSRRTIDVSTTARKSAAFGALMRQVRREGEPTRNPLLFDLAGQAGFEPHDLCRELCMGWDEIRELAADPLVTIGAHTRTHPILANLDDDEAREDISAGRDELEEALGRPVEHLAYPVGDASAASEREYRLARALGFKTAVTTRKGLVHPSDAGRLERLSRVTLNGHFQSTRYLELFLSGAPYALARAFSSEVDPAHVK
jgi:peptidoglycan/xylan/chitin deacetylase (PgdA/CDA1 family)